MILEPFDADGSHETVNEFEPGVALTAIGADGARAEGVTAGVEIDAGPVPIAFVAVTTKVYRTPFFRPLTMQVVATLELESAVAAHVAPPGVAVTT